ncbi:sensor histidine kinase [Haloplanus sp. C73]|uniref:sensor histidine kinase n=1 Tax=Haloplanus sp. C73 TaxID=3421641 RepID=UPI003EBF49FF
MNAETLYVAVVLLASGFVSVVAAWLWSDDLDRPGRLFTLTVGLHLPVGVFVAAELLAPTRQLAVLFYTLHTGLSSAIPLVFVLFALAFTADRRTPSNRLIAGVAVYAAVLFGLEVTNPIHGYARTGYEVVGATIPHLSGTPTPLFTVLTLPVFVGYYAAIGILGYRFLVRREARWRQTLVLFVGFVPPFAVTGLWISGLLIGPLNGAFVIGSSWMVSFAGWAVFRYQLFDLVPLARETVFEALDERVIVVDDELRLLDYNETAATTFPVLSDAHGESLDRLLPGLLAESSDPDEGEHPFASTFGRTDESTPREYTVDVSQLHTGGSVRGYVLVIRDITDRQRHIRDLEQQTAQLERFASTLSHDLRNPLNVARGRTELALEGDGKSNLRTALDALDRVDRIIDDLLTLAREGRTIDDRQRVSLVDVVEGAWRTTNTDGATLQIEVDPTVSVYADRTRLQNVFENLFRNSVEHGSTNNRRAERADDSVEHGSTNSRMESGDSVEHGSTDARAEDHPITVTVGRHDSGFYVEDDGPGIPPENRESVLEYEFTTGDGTGLGLAIVDAIAQAHGWSVSVESGRDGGARITFDDVSFADDEASVERAAEPLSADVDT